MCLHAFDVWDFQLISYYVSCAHCNMHVLYAPKRVKIVNKYTGVKRLCMSQHQQPFPFLLAMVVPSMMKGIIKIDLTADGALLLEFMCAFVCCFN